MILLSIQPCSQHLFRKAQKFLPFRARGAFLVAVVYYALVIVFSSLIGISPIGVSADTATATKAFLLAFSVPASVSVLNDIDRAFAAIGKHVPKDHHESMEKWLREFCAVLQAQSRGAAALYVIGCVLTASFAGYLLFLNPYIHQRLFDLYSRRGIAGPKASIFLMFDFLSFFVPMSVVFVFALGVWLSGITWLVLRVDDDGYPYAVGRTWPASRYWRRALSPIIVRITGKPWIGGSIRVEPNAYHHDRHGGLRSVIDVHFRAMIAVAIALGLFAAYTLQGLPLFDTFLILVSLGNIIFITFVLITNSSRKFLITLRQREFFALETRIFALRHRLSADSTGTFLDLLKDIREAGVLRFLVSEVEKIPTWPIGLSGAAFSIGTPVIAFLAEQYLAALLRLAS